MERKKKKYFKLVTAICAIWWIVVVLYIMGTVFLNIGGNKNNVSTVLSSEGLQLLNDYEYPKNNEQNREDMRCMVPYDVEDGVTTFGAGVTFPTAEEGFEKINNEYGTDYGKENNCISVDILNEFQILMLEKYELDVLNFFEDNQIEFVQNQFDGLLILDYNSPEVLKYEPLINLLKNDKDTVLKEEFIDVIDSYYRQFPAYYDNPNTNKRNDGFGEGWYNRILDVADVYFDSQYEFQQRS